MKQKKIGDFTIHPIGIGTWSVGGWYHPNYGHDKNEVEAIRYSLQLGQNHIDTAEMYSAGHAEEIVGKAIKGFDRSKIFIASKVYKHHQDKKDIISAIEKMLGRLDTGYLDLVYIHSPGNIAPVAVYLEGLNEAVDSGLITYIGVSKFDLSQLTSAQSQSAHPIVAVQNLYHVGGRDYVDKKFLHYCQMEQIMLVAHSPLEGCTRLREVIQTAEKYGKTPYQIALNWLIAQDGVVTIPKSVTKTHITENVGALDFELEREDFELLSAL